MCSILLSCTAQYITFRIRVASWVSISWTRVTHTVRVESRVAIFNLKKHSSYPKIIPVNRFRTTLSLNTTGISSITSSCITYLSAFPSFAFTWHNVFLSVLFQIRSNSVILGRVVSSTGTQVLLRPRRRVMKSMWDWCRTWAENHSYYYSCSVSFSPGHLYFCVSFSFSCAFCVPWRHPQGLVLFEPRLRFPRHFLHLQSKV